jgi:hypothetical protein
MLLLLLYPNSLLSNWGKVEWVAEIGIIPVPPFSGGISLFAENEGRESDYSPIDKMEVDGCG